MSRVSEIDFRIKIKEEGFFCWHLSLMLMKLSAVSRGRRKKSVRLDKGLIRNTEKNIEQQRTLEILTQAEATKQSRGLGRDKRQNFIKTMYLYMEIIKDWPMSHIWSSHWDLKLSTEQGPSSLNRLQGLPLSGSNLLPLPGILLCFLLPTPRNIYFLPPRLTAFLRQPAPQGCRPCLLYW